jgi:hypothetical protein
VAAATLNVWREKGSEPIKPKDFLPEERPSEEEIERLAVEFFEDLSRRQQKQKTLLEKRKPAN